MYPHGLIIIIKMKIQQIFHIHIKVINKRFIIEIYYNSLIHIERRSNEKNDNNFAKVC